MTRSIVIGLAVVMISTSGAWAAHRYHHYHHHYASPALSPSEGPRAWGGLKAYAGPIKPDDYNMYLKNLHDAGYDPKNDYAANGLLKNQ
jgi:hypothetical protein